jgi:hypothetical protein
MAIGSARFNLIEDREMNVILGFMPFIAFAVLTRVASIGLSLWAAAAIAAVMAARSWLAAPGDRNRSSLWLVRNFLELRSMESEPADGARHRR